MRRIDGIPGVPAAARPHTQRLALALAFPLILATPAAGQPGLLLHGGAVLPTARIGPATTAAGPWYIDLAQPDPATLLGASFVLPVTGTFEARLTAMGMFGAQARGFFTCYDGLACPAVRIEGEVGVRTLAAWAEVAWSPFAGVVRPYALAGAGVRHDRFDWDGSEELVGAIEESAIAFSSRAGLGLAVPLGRWALHAELTDAWSPSEPLDAPDAPLGAPARNARNDLLLTVGIRVF